MKRRHFTAIAALGSAAVLLPAASQAQVTDINDAINKAGRQRMLSQRMAKSYLAEGEGVVPQLAQRTLANSMALFDRQLVELKVFAPLPEIKSTYGALEGVWSDYKAALVGSKPAKEQAETVLDLAGKVLALAHQGTVQLEKVSGKPVGRLVNVSGRQRMLSQRMAKFYLAAMLPVDASTATTEIAKARSEFIAATELLRNAPQATNRIRQELQLADGQWVFFDAALQRMQGGGNVNRQVAEVYVASENLLSSMDRVTGMYAALAA